MKVKQKQESMQIWYPDAKSYANVKKYTNDKRHAKMKKKSLLIFKYEFKKV